MSTTNEDDDFKMDGSNAVSKTINGDTVKSETSNDCIKCAFCPDTVPTTQIIAHTQMHTKEWEKEDQDLGDSENETGDVKKEANEQNPTENKPPDEDMMNCSLCQQNVLKSTIYEHTYQHMFATRKMHPCHLCDKTYKDKTQLNMHLMVHTGEKPFQCDRCEKTFRLAQSLKNHINIHHTKANLETCDQCGETFTYKKGLIGHLSKAHGIDTAFKCQNCGERFLTEQGIKKHELDACFKYCCTDCGKMFKRASHLDKHKEVHTEKGEKEFIYNCEQCGKEFPTADALKRHTILHLNLRQFQCFCGKAFNRKDNLRAHEKTHQNQGAIRDSREAKETPPPSDEDKSALQAAVAQSFAQRDMWQRQQQQFNWNGSGRY